MLSQNLKILTIWLSGDPSMSDYPRLDSYDLSRAIYWWWRKLNTHQIAEKLDVDEASVANSLAAWRDEEYKRRTAA